MEIPSFFLLLVKSEKFAITLKKKKKIRFPWINLVTMLKFEAFNFNPFYSCFLFAQSKVMNCNEKDKVNSTQAQQNLNNPKILNF